jgi:hypothetical protein
MLVSVEVSERYRSALWAALAGSLLIPFLDCGGALFAIPTIAALLVFWGWVMVTICRRPKNPTCTDLALIRWGCLPFVAAFDVAISLVWHWRGLI